MKLNNEFKEIKNDEYIKKIDGSGLDKITNEFFSLINEANQLRLQSNIANMDQVVVSTNEKPVIGTQALDTCFGILFYDRKNKFGICGHADPNSISYIIIEMLKQIPLNTDIEIEYVIVPGYRAIEQKNFKAIDEIRSLLDSYTSIYPKINFVSLKTSLNPVMPSGLLCYDFAFDTRTGLDVTDIVFRNTIVEQNSRHL